MNCHDLSWFPETQSAAEQARRIWKLRKATPEASRRWEVYMMIVWNWVKCAFQRMIFADIASRVKGNYQPRVLIYRKHSKFCSEFKNWFRWNNGLLFSSTLGDRYQSSIPLLQWPVIVWSLTVSPSLNSDELSIIHLKPPSQRKVGHRNEAFPTDLSRGGSYLQFPWRQGTALRVQWAAVINTSRKPKWFM